MTDAVHLRRKRVSTACGLTVGGLAYGLTLLNYSTDLGRTALPGKIFSGFFDLQMRAILSGRLSMDPDTLGIEGFVHDGKTYTYFPPFPALLRLPVVMTTREFDGLLTVLSMAVAWVVLATVTAKMLWLLVHRFTGTRQVSRSAAFLVGASLAGLTGGTFLTYDASLPWVYHEVYIWAVTAATGSVYWMIRVLTDERSESVRWLFWFALVTVGSRATEGWAVSLTIIALGLMFRLRPRTPQQRSLWWKVLLAGLVPLAASITLNLVKFDAIYMFPLQDQVWTELSPQRRAALAANGGSLTGPQFFLTSFMAYLRPDGIRFTEWFPWISLPSGPPTVYNGAFVDQLYRTGSVTAFMPLAMLGFLVTLVLAWRPRADARIRVLRAPLVTTILITGGVMGYGYYANRYTSEFVPAMILGGAAGTALLASAVTSRPRWFVPSAAVTTAGVAFSIAAHMATGMQAAAVYYRGEPLQRYLSWQQELSATPPPVMHTDGIPRGGTTDQLAVKGDCDALFLNTGDIYEPWIAVEERDRVLVFRRTDQLRPGITTIATSTGETRTAVRIQTDREQRVRFVIWNGDQLLFSDWRSFSPEMGRELRVGVRHYTDWGAYEFDADRFWVIGHLASRYIDSRINTRLTEFRIEQNTHDLQRMGLRMHVEQGPTPELCRRIADRAENDLPD